MSTYTPDAWVIIKLVTPKDTLYKVLAGWYGGYAYGDSWKINSGITVIRDLEHVYEIDGYSGSTYVCPKITERLTGLTASILNSFEEQAKENEGFSIEVVPISEVIEFLKK